MPLWYGVQSSEHLIYDCKILALERDILKQQIKTRGGTWPPTNSDLIEIYLDVFSKFIKSIEVSKTAIKYITPLVTNIERHKRTG